MERYQGCRGGSGREGRGWSTLRCDEWQGWSWILREDVPQCGGVCHPADLGRDYSILRSWRGSAAAQKDLLYTWKKRRAGSHVNFLSSYMLDITAEVVAMPDSEASGGTASGSLLVDKTLDVVGSKGTGLWSVQEALGAGVPAPSLAAAVLSRQMTMYRSKRLENAKQVNLPVPEEATGYENEDLEDLYWSAGFAIIASYAQMFQCLRVLYKEFGFGLHMPSTIATFRAGCILQGYLLGPMTKAFEDNPDLSNLMCAFATEIQAELPRFRRCMAKLVRETNQAAPVMMASLQNIESMVTTESSPAKRWRSSATSSAAMASSVRTVRATSTRPGRRLQPLCMTA